MIRISHLTKIFQSKHKEKCVALNNVSVDLENKGFVFIVGKSGSGKTTLLNMIAALDSYDSGEIIINGLNLNHLNHNQYDYYRNKNIGFIFQDYQLLDELTVFDNVKVALDFIDDKDTSKVYKALESVGLKGFEKRYPNQLSGGEKQRVAIARAMVKDPTIILADEPTGNLDSVTSKEILNILKEISKTKLVLIVSHNIFDAHEFASLILELSYGKLIGTYKRNETKNYSIEVKDAVLRLPLHKDLIESEKVKVIEDINNGVKEVIQDDKDFVPCELVNKNKETPNKLVKKHISFKNAFKLGITFLKKSLSTIAVYSLIIASLFGIIYSSEIIIKTDIYESINETKINYDKDLITLSDYDSVGLYPGQKHNINSLMQEDVDLIKEKGYKGKIYPTYSLFNSYNYDTIAQRVPSGIKIVDNDYFLNFVDELDFVCKNPEYKKEGVYITDYIVDNYNLHFPADRVNYDDYEIIEQMCNLIHLNGVINTHYKEKYQDINEKIKEYIVLNKDSKVFDEISDERMDEYYYDLTFYSHAYSLEKDFIDCILESDLSGFYGYNTATYNYKGKSYSPINNSFLFWNKDFNSIGYDIYEKITGKRIEIQGSDIVKLDEPITIDIDLFKSKLYSYKTKSVTVTFDHVYRDNWYGYTPAILNKSNKELCKEFIALRDVTLENNEDLKNIFKQGLVKNLVINNFTDQVMYTHDRLTSIFNKIFKLVIILLVLAVFVSLIFYSAYIVKKNVRNIGILKSLGGRSKDILIALSLNIILTSIIASILSVGFSYLFLFIVEKILLTSFKSASMDFTNIYNVSYLLNDEMIIGFNIIFIVMLLVLSSLFIFIRLNKYKPTELIKGAK